MVIAAASAVVISRHGSNSTATATTASTTLTGPAGPEGIALEEDKVLAPASGAARGATVGGIIQCNAADQAVYHIHTHLMIYVDGSLRPVPGGIGVVQPVAQQTPEGPFYGASKCYYWLHTRTHVNGKPYAGDPALDPADEPRGHPARPRQPHRGPQADRLVDVAAVTA